MNRFALRPRFDQDVEFDIEATENLIIDYFRKEAENFEVKHFPGFICLRIPKADRHFWSPRLNLSLEEIDDQKTVIRGTYGPNANVWSLFLFSYLIFGFLAMVGGFVVISQKAIGAELDGLWMLIAPLAVVIVLYIVARIGKRIGTSQTLRLHRLFEKAIGERIPIR